MTSEPGTTESKRYCSVATMTDTALYSTPSEMKALTAANQRLEQEFQSLLVALEQERITTCELKASFPHDLSLLLTRRTYGLLRQI